MKPKKGKDLQIDDFCDRRECDGCGCKKPEVRRVCGGLYCLVCQPWTSAEIREIRADEELHRGL